MRGFNGYCDVCGAWGHSKKYCKWGSGMRPMWEEDGGWSEEPEMEEQAGDSLCCLREEASEDGGIRTLEQEVSEEEAEKMSFKGKWIKIEAEVDTGACVPMMPTSLAKHLKIRESEGSRRGAKYVSASDDFIYNKGESDVLFASDAGDWRKAVIQRGDVNKTLMAGGSVADKGNTLLFTKFGGMIIKDPDLSIYKKAVGMAKVKTPFRRKGKTYAMNMWLKAPTPEGGTRRVGFKDEEPEGEAGEEGSYQKMLAMAAENGWKVAGWRGKGGREFRPTFGRQGP